MWLPIENYLGGFDLKFWLHPFIVTPSIGRFLLALAECLQSSSLRLAWEGHSGPWPKMTENNALRVANEALIVRCFVTGFLVLDSATSTRCCSPKERGGSDGSLKNLRRYERQKELTSFIDLKIQSKCGQTFFFAFQTNVDV